MIDAKTPKEFFEKLLPNRFNPEKAVDIDITVQVNIVGANEGNWIVTIKEQKLEIQEGTHPSPTLALKMTESDFLDLINGRISGEKAFFLGKLRVKGNIALALKLRETGFF
jgi:putative sterol carrier protein